MKRNAVFIDKDGTLVHDVPYNTDPARIELTPGAGLALSTLRDASYLLVVVSNQPGIAERRFTVEALLAAYARIGELLHASGVSLDGFYWCPHAADAAPACDCRKPAPGLLLRAAAELDVDLPSSWMLGDILNDVEAGRRAGCRSILVDCGNEDRWEMNPWRMPDAIVSNLPAAANFIVSLEGYPIAAEATG